MRGREGGEGENSEDIRGTLEEAVKSKAARSKGRGTGSEKVVDLPTTPSSPSLPLPPSAEERVALKANGGNKHHGIMSVNSRKANEKWTGLGGGGKGWGHHRAAITQRM